MFNPKKKGDSELRQFRSQTPPDTTIAGNVDDTADGEALMKDKIRHCPALLARKYEKSQVMLSGSHVPAKSHPVDLDGGFGYDLQYVPVTRWTDIIPHLKLLVRVWCGEDQLPARSIVFKNDLC